MSIAFYKPRSVQLQKVIEGYYFLKSNDPDFELNYFTFPNNYSILSILEQAQLELLPDKVLCTSSGNPGFHSSLTYSYDKPLHIVYQGSINEITIYFKPLGLNHFLINIPVHLSKAQFGSFYPFIDFQEQLLTILQEPDRNRQIDLLESYWLSKLGNRVNPLLKNIVEQIASGNSISRTADELNISRQYLSKLFTQQVGKSPSGFRRIQQFRNAVASSSGSKSLTTLGLDNLFYDQSHFIKSFKDFTALTPGAFFKEADTRQPNLWLYV